MRLRYVLLLLALASISDGQPRRCDQTPPDARDKEPSDGKHPFMIDIDNAEKRDGKIIYTADQTYVLSLATSQSNRTFRWFMITAEDPDVDNIASNQLRSKEVGSLKTLDIQQSRHSERCANSVENFDNADKTRVEIHWVSPHKTSVVRIRAMVAENDEVWYVGPALTMMLYKEERQARDSSPYPLNNDCKLCSEARYEVIFNGKWSRVAHPRHYPTKPDENGYTHMLGASHDSSYFLWKAGSKASEGLGILLENGNTTALEREIIGSMNETSGTRTLIRGKRRHHPYMFEPSHSLFRVDRFHHLFSIVVGLRPSPDWFLGMTQFELCLEDNWVDYSEVPLFPWDAGTRSGVSYESDTAPTQDNIERVEVGSFNKDSPFYQKNLNDLQVFATLQVRRLDVYPLDESICPGFDADQQEETNEPSDEPQPYPMLSESRQRPDPGCYLGEWGEWSACTTDVGNCGIGAQTRTRQQPRLYYAAKDNNDDSPCQEEDSNFQEMQHCYVDC